MDPDAEPSKSEPVGPYTIHTQIAAGGMARVHLGQRTGPLGFSRTVAIKRLHPQLVKDTEFVSMLVDEARLAARIAHPNVGTVLDVVATGSEVLLVLDYIRGESLSRLLALSADRCAKVPIRIATAVVAGVLRGLHAAHETQGPNGELLGVIHRDVTPQNILVGADGLARVVDFGIARAAGNSHLTPIGQVRGKLAYMAPEQLREGPVDRRADVYAASAVLWEALVGRRCFDGSNDGATVTKVLAGAEAPPSQWEATVPPELDAIVMKGLAYRPEDRFESTRDMAVALEREVGVASTSEVGDWVEVLAAVDLAQRDELVRAMAPVQTAETVSEDPIPVDPAGTRRLGLPASGWPSTDGSPSSRPSVVSVPSGRAAGKDVGTRRLWVVAGAGIALAVAAFAVWVTPRPHPPVVWAAPTTEPPVAAAAPGVDETVAPAIPTPIPAASLASEAPSSRAVATRIAAPVARPEAPAPSSHVASKSSASRPVDSPRHRDDCSPPYTVDAMQIKHFKIECLP
jgi:serine/threonine protein kinase